MVPADELDSLLIEEPTARVVDRGRRLEAERRTGEQTETVSIGLYVAEPTEENEVTTRRRRPLLPYDTTRWIGTDGRPARVVQLEPGGKR